MAKILNIKAKVVKSLESDIAAYYELKNEIEAMKENIIAEMSKNGLRTVETDDFKASLTEVQQREIDAEAFHDSLDKKQIKHFFKMIRIVKTKAQKWVGSDQIEEFEFVTSSYDRFDVKKKKKVFKK